MCPFSLDCGCLGQAYVLLLVFSPNQSHLEKPQGMNYEGQFHGRLRSFHFYQYTSESLLSRYTLRSDTMEHMLAEQETRNFWLSLNSGLVFMSKLGV